MKLSKSRYPTSGKTIVNDLYLDYDSSTGRGPAQEQPIIGKTSGATGVVMGYLKDPDRVIVRTTANGAGGVLGTPFLPNEVIEQVSDDNISVTLSSSLKQTSSASASGGKGFEIDIPP